MAIQLLPPSNFKKTREYLEGYNDALAHVQHVSEMTDDEMNALGLPPPDKDQTTGCITCGAYLVKLAVAFWHSIHK